MNVVGHVEDDLDVELFLERMIAENGYAQISVHDQGDTDRPGFAFTVGLETSRAMPELLCLGVAPDVAGQLFSLCIAGQEAGTFDLSDGLQDVGGLITGHLLRFRPTPAPVLQRANAIRHRRMTDICRMVQILLPDNDGIFPGEPTCDPWIAAAQDTDRLLASPPN